jgi:hypothetical protein
LLETLERRQRIALPCTTRKLNQEFAGGYHLSRTFVRINIFIIAVNSTTQSIVNLTEACSSNAKIISNVAIWIWKFNIIIDI